MTGHGPARRSLTTALTSALAAGVTAATGCSITAATLRLCNAIPTPGRVVEAYRIDPAAAWSVSTVTRNSRPDRVAATVTSAVGTVADRQEWDATALAQGLYAFGNNGLPLSDRTEVSSSAKTQKYDSDDGAGTNYAQLSLTWG